MNISIDINQSAVEQQDEFDRTKEQQDQLLEEMVPRMNKEAARLVDVYRLIDLIDTDLLDRLDNEAIAVLKGPPDDLPYVFRPLLLVLVQLHNIDTHFVDLPIFS